MDTTTSRNQLLRVGDLARRTNKTVRAIHLYEELGLLMPATRTSGGFRLYDPTAVDRVKWIDMLHGMGFSLQEMRTVLRDWWSSQLGPEAMGRLRTLFEEKLEQTRESIRRHQELEQELRDGLAYLQTCGGCGTTESVVGCVHCGVDHGVSREPVLVSGLKSSVERTARPRSNRSAFVPLSEVERPREAEG